MEAFEKRCNEMDDMDALITFQRSQQSVILKRDIKKRVAAMLEDGKSDEEVWRDWLAGAFPAAGPAIVIQLHILSPLPPLQIIAAVREAQTTGKLTETEVVALLWPTIMSSVDMTNKNTQLLVEQVLRQIKVGTTVVLPVEFCILPFVWLLLWGHPFTQPHNNTRRTASFCVDLRARSTGSSNCSSWCRTTATTTRPCSRPSTRFA